MMRSALALIACLATASAFAPASRTTTAPTTTTSLEGMDSMRGSFDFRGKEWKFDPLNLSETYEPLLPWFRECELRHGRTAMLAVMGFVATDFVRIPGDMYSFEAIPKTVDAHDILIEQGPMVQLLLWVGLWDLIVTGPAAAAAMKGEREAGDFAWTMFAPTDSAKLDKKRDSELMNGRLAMMAVGGIATQSIISGHGFPYI